MRACIVVDLGFGDAGKGLLTDFLVRHLNATLVVRYNGGAQAGHNVVTPDGRHHTFSQFGAGTFSPGVRTCLSRHVVVHPAALLTEGDILVAKGIADAYSRLRISEQALIITPFHQAANRIRELARRANRHGSCGVGVGEAVEDAKADPQAAPRAADLAHPPLLRRKLEYLRERKRAQLADLCRRAAPGSPLATEWGLFERPQVIDLWLQSIARVTTLGLVAPDELLGQWLHEAQHVVFEGAQGVLLDAQAGFHPHTTWSRCTQHNAHQLLAELAPGASAFTLGVLRSHAVRHGPGPLPTETDELAPLIRDHNCHNEWQGAVRYGWFDAVLARYALHLTGGVDALALTHLDLLSRLPSWKYCPAYHRPPQDEFFTPSRTSPDLREDIALPRRLSLARRARFTQALQQVLPAFAGCPPEEGTVLRTLESLLSQPVDVLSRGPTASHVRLQHPLPF